MDTAHLKYSIIEKLIRTEDEKLLKKVAALMRSEPVPYPETELKPMSAEEFNERIRRAEDDIVAGRVYTTEEAKKKLRPMLVEELEERILESRNDITEGRFHTSEELKNHFLKT
ncbi:MAG: hypothetical protein K9G46_05200 [Flavobacteriales bacterium]|jgi:ribosomal protein L29|nr:hypothetical protein [Flavobacteriales bacterium]